MSPVFFLLNFALFASFPSSWFSSNVLIVFGASMGEIILAVLTDPIIVLVGIVTGPADKFLMLTEPGLSSI